MLVTPWVAAAHAADVVWLTPPSATDRAAVDAAGGGASLDPLELRGATARWTPRDQEALDRLDAAVRGVRQYETRLDGELIILHDLEAPIHAVRALRDADDRHVLYAALAYQGFAVDRYWADALSSDPEAVEWRVDRDGRSVPRAWVDALALEPDREVSSYEIGEAPQRLAYAEVQRDTAAWLPATLVPEDLPAGGRLVVDGRPAELDAAGTVKVRAGRHLAHVEVDHGSEPLVLQRWELTLEPAGRAVLRPDLDDATWDGWIAALAPGSAVPAPIGAAVEALGGEVWVARGSGRRLEILVVRPDAVSAPPAPDRPRVSFAAAAGGGWWFDDDFWLQSPYDTPRTAATVNAGAVTASASARMPLGALGLGFGADVAVPLGDDHVVEVGALRLRPRPHPWLGVGVGPVMATAGWLFPWHPGLGLRADLPIAGPLELVPRVVVGVPMTVRRAGGDYSTGELVTAQLLVGARWPR